MKILVFSQLYHPETATITELCERLVEQGHNVTVMTGIPNAPKGEIFQGYGFTKKLREIINGVDVRRNWLIPRGSGNNLRMSINYLSFVLFCSLGIIRLAKNSYDIILVNQLSPITVALPAILYKWISKKKIVMWIHDLWPDSVIAAKAMKEGFFYRLIDRLVKFIYRQCDFFLPQSKAMLNTLNDRGLSDSKMKYLPNPIDSNFSPSTSESRRKKPSIMTDIDDKFSIMFAGGIGLAQDFDTILNAAVKLKDLKNLQILIVGDGRDKLRAESLSKSLDIASFVHFLGQHPIDEMPDFYDQADFMMVTLRDTAIFSVTVPLKIQTYMASGKPIISNVKGEAARVIKQANCGYSVNPEDSEALAQAIRNATCLSTIEIDKLGANARAYFNLNYSTPVIIDRFESVCHELLDS